MKTLFNILTAFMLFISFSGCSDNEEPALPVTLPVTYANIEGTWQLTEWNGQPLPDGNYCYMELDRKDHTFTLYQKFDSMYGRTITGEYHLEEDPLQGTLISGTYDYGMGAWNRTYLVTELTEEGSMLWTATDDEGDVCRYERCEEIPDEVK